MKEADDRVLFEKFKFAKDLVMNLKGDWQR